MLDEFVIDSKYGVFQGITYPPLAISLGAFRMMLPKRALPAGLLKLVLKHLLLVLDFLHTEAKVIHTGKATAMQEQTLA
jgi:serine/threonine-protein kinase SRPK3